MGLVTPDSDTTIERALAQSRGEDGHACLSPGTRRWAEALAPQMPARFLVHQDAAAQRAADALGVTAFAFRDRIVLGPHGACEREAILRHELVHLAQLQCALRTGKAAQTAQVEAEADAISRMPTAVPVQRAADPTRPHPIIWWVAIGAGLYMALRPRPANAPTYAGDIVRGPSGPQIMVEAASIFVIPAGAIGLGGRLGLGFFGKSMLASATSAMGLRAAGDIGRGQPSPPLMYVFDAATGAVIGYVVPGGFRLIGRAGTASFNRIATLGRAGTERFDRLATYGLTQSDLAVTQVLAERAALGPLNAAQAQQILTQRGMAGKVSHWWLQRRGVILLYRGQGYATDRILSPIARQEGVAASEALVARLRQLGLTPQEMADYTAKFHTQPIPKSLAPPGAADIPIGAVGIPTTRHPGIAANFGDDGVVYVIRIPASSAIPASGWQGLALESEYIILNQVPKGGIVQVIPAREIAPLTIDPQGLLIPGTR